jgi:hypothetical protein
LHFVHNANLTSGICEKAPLTEVCPIPHTWCEYALQNGQLNPSELSCGVVYGIKSVQNKDGFDEFNFYNFHNPSIDYRKIVCLEYY